MNKLIYFSVVGIKYKKMVYMSIASLRKNNYEGEILILSDEDKIIDENTRMINSLDKLQNKFHKRISAKSMKAFIKEFVDISKYEYTMYFDADILFYKNIDGFYKEMDDNLFIVQYDRFTDIKSDSLVSGCEFLSKETRDKYSLRINSGLVGQKFNKDFCIFDLWKQTMIDKNFEFHSDQGALYATVVNNIIDNKVYCSKLGDFNYYLKTYSGLIYVHYNGIGFDTMVGDYNKYINVSPSKTLVYYSVIGNKYKKMLEMSIFSLRKCGYKDDVIILSDEDKIIDNNTTMINSVDILKKYSPYITAKIMKAFIKEFVDISKYEYTMYFDADILFYKNIDGFYKEMDDNLFIVQYDRFTDIKSDSLVSGCEFLSKETRDKYSLRINSGLVGQKFNKDFCIFDLWKQTMTDKKFEFNDDQGALYATVVKKSLERNIYESKIGDFYYGLKNYDNLTYVHYNGKGFMKMTNDYNEYIDNNLNRYNKIKGCLSDFEHEALREHIFFYTKGKKEVNIVEIGTYNAKTSICIADYLLRMKIIPHIYTFDIYSLANSDGWLAPYSIEKNVDMAKSLGLEKYINFIKITPGDYAKIQSVLSNIYIDVVYIDGDHTYEYAKNDILLAKNLTNSESLICGDDYYYRFPGVIQAVNELIPNKAIYGKFWTNKSFDVCQQISLKLIGKWIGISKKDDKVYDIEICDDMVCKDTNGNVIGKVIMNSGDEYFDIKFIDVLMHLKFINEDSIISTGGSIPFKRKL